MVLGVGVGDAVWGGTFETRWMGRDQPRAFSDFCLDVLDAVAAPLTRYRAATKGDVAVQDLADGIVPVVASHTTRVRIASRGIPTRTLRSIGRARRLVVGVVVVVVVLVRSSGARDESTSCVGGQRAWHTL